MNQKEWTHRKVSFTEKKSEEIINYHKLERTGCFCMTFFIAYNVTHARFEENKLLKRSLNSISGNEFFKYVIDGKVYMKLSVKTREKIIE